MEQGDKAFPVATIKRQIIGILRAWSMPADLADMAAEVMGETDLSGVDSHGITVMPMYDDMRREGKLRLAAVPKVTRETPTTAVIDAGGSLGHPAGVIGMRLAIEKAKQSNVAVVSVFNSHHFGAAGYYAEMAARAGCIGMVTSSTRFVSLVPTRGAEPVLGTNPIAFAAPAGKHEPVVLDMATSAVAINKIKVHQRNKWPLPPGWAVDGDGKPLTDPDEALRYILERPEGGVTPIGGSSKELGGHKGYGMALFVHILASTLVGASFSPIRNKTQPASAPENIGHFFLAINPEAFRPLAEFGADMDQVIDTLHGVKPADPANPVLVPGEPERMAREQRGRDGIVVQGSIRTRLQEIATAAGAEYQLTDAAACSPRPSN
jgi:LDH2 family malate/lactate/ureidoglycolate dehydrogenase